MALAFTLGGVDHLSFIDFTSIRLQQTEEVKGSTFDFYLREYETPVARPRAGAEVIFTDGSTREFAGVLLEVGRELGEGNRLIKYNCRCIDYTYYLDRRLLNKVYTAKRADLMFEEILDDLQAAANNESSGGDTHYNDFQGDKTQIGIGISDQTKIPVIPEQRFERVLPSKAFDTIAEIAVYRWFINFSKQVTLTTVGTAQAPLPLEDSTGNAFLDVENNNTVWDVFDEESIEGIGTKAILKGALTRSTASIENKFIWHTGEEVIFRLSLRPFSNYDITSVVANSVTLTQRLEYTTLQPEETPTSGECAVYIGRIGGSPSYVRLNPANIADGQAVVVTFNYILADDYESPDFARYTPLAERTGGDGIHEFVYSRNSEIVARGLEELDSIQDILLGRKSRILIRGSFTTWIKGWNSGQVFQLQWANEALNEQVYVIRVGKQVLTPYDDPNIGDNIIVSKVQYSNIPRGIRL